MIFQEPLIKGTLLQRYKRFLADVQLDNGEIITAYCANPGALRTLKTPGSEIWLSVIPETAKRKLRYEWQLVRVGGALVGVNTRLPNLLVEEALNNRVISEVSEYPTWRREVRYGLQSRIDFLLTGPGLPVCYLEVKNVNHKEGNTAFFPDCKTIRGTKHLRELAEMAKTGHRAIVLYVLQRSDCDRFALANHIDPAYTAAAHSAKAAGVEFLCYSCRMSIEEIKIIKPLLQEEI